MKFGIYYHGNLQKESGGGFTFQDDLIRDIRKTNRRHEIYIISFDGDHAPPPEEGGIKYIRLSDYRNNRQEAEETLFSALKKKIFKTGPAIETNLLNKIVRDHHIELLWFISPFVGKVTIPYMINVWDLAHRTYPYFPEVSISGWKWEDREKHYSQFLPRAACILTGTNAGKEEIVNYYRVPEHLVKVIPFPTPSFALNAGLVSPFASPEEKPDLPEKYLFYPAQFWPHKNHIGLLLALKILNTDYNLGFKLILTGSDTGNLSYIKEKIKDLNLEKDVQILGFVKTEDLVALYRNAFALLYPTFLGPDNLPPLEAFALGCPVIASNVSGAKEQLDEAALLFDPQKPEEIALKVKMLHNGSQQRTQMIKNGQLRAKQLSMNNYIDEVLNFVDSFESIRRCWSSTDNYIHK